jgi:ubiquinone biosynthesis protein Coq4
MSSICDKNSINSEKLFSSILNMVRASDGDFTALGNLGEACIDHESYEIMIGKLSSNPQGKKAFEERLLLGTIDLIELKKLSNDTLGYLYAEHMIQNQLKPLQSPSAESDHQFLDSHLTETHDIWHVVTGSKTDILGEIQLEAFYVAQFEISRFWLALLVKNLLKAVAYDIESSTQYMEALTRGWRMGRKAKPLFGVNWNNLWTTSIQEVRFSLNLLDV